MVNVSFNVTQSESVILSDYWGFFVVLSITAINILYQRPDRWEAGERRGQYKRVEQADGSEAAAVPLRPVRFPPDEAPTEFSVHHLTPVRRRKGDERSCKTLSVS